MERPPDRHWFLLQTHQQWPEMMSSCSCQAQGRWPAADHASYWDTNQAHVLLSLFYKTNSYISRKENSITHSLTTWYIKHKDTANSTHRSALRRSYSGSKFMKTKYNSVFELPITDPFFLFIFLFFLFSSPSSFDWRKKAYRKAFSYLHKVAIYK